MGEGWTSSASVYSMISVHRLEDCSDTGRVRDVTRKDKQAMATARLTDPNGHPKGLNQSGGRMWVFTLMQPRFCWLDLELQASL